MSKIERIYQGLNEIQKYYQDGVLQKLFFDWKHYIGTELNIEYGKECAGRNVVINGKTYQNLFRAELNQGHANSSYSDTATYNTRINSVGFTLPIGTYTITISNKYELIIYKNYGSIENTYYTYLGWLNKITWANNSQSNNIRIMVRKVDNSNITIDEVKGKIVLLEGDYTDIDIPTSIDGIESVAEREENLVNTATIYESMLESGVVDSLFNPKSSSTYDVYKMEIQPNTEYLFNLVGYGQAPWVRILDKNNIIVKSQNLSSSGLSYIWSLKTEDNFYYLVFNKPKTSTGTFQVYKKENPYPLKLAINEEINLINLPIPLRSLPNGVYDTIEENKLVQRVGKVVLDESNASNFKQVNTMQVFRWEYFFDTKEFVSGICDKFPIKNVQTLANENKGIRLSGTSFSGIDIKFPNDTEFDINAFRTWLSENPVTVYYELATPIETPITPDMILINGEPITDTVGIELPDGTKDSIENDCYVKRVGKVIIDGKNGAYQRSGTTTSTLNVYVVRKLGINITLKTLNTNYIYQCDSEIDMSKYITVGKWLSDSTSGSVVFKVPTEEYLWSDIHNAFLENPITLYVELATPVKIPLFSIKEGLTTLKSTNNITPQLELDCLVRDKFQNMCDNEWEAGDISIITGELSGNTSRIRLIKYIEVKPNTKYKWDIVKKTNGISIGIRHYDISKTYINGHAIGNIGNAIANKRTFTTPEDCCYIRFIAETTDTNFKIYLKEVIN